MPLKNTLNELLSPQNGVVGIADGSETKYFISFLKATTQAPHTQFKQPSTMVNFVFDHQRNIIALCYSRKECRTGHDGIATKIGAPSSITSESERDRAIVGGRIKFENETFVTSEWSGHYGHLWTDFIRHQFIRLLNQLTNIPVIHCASRHDFKQALLQTPSERGGILFFEPILTSESIKKSADQTPLLVEGTKGSDIELRV
jgi:hypothetical protein